MVSVARRAFQRLPIGSTHRNPVVASRVLTSVAAQMRYSVCRDPESGNTIRLAEHYDEYGFVIAEDLLSHTTVPVL